MAYKSNIIWEDKHPAKFRLTKEHIRLIRNLNIKPSQDPINDMPFVPSIDLKRPFGNDCTLSDILHEMKIELPATEPGINPTELTNAYTALAELPTALRTILFHMTFKPGIYDIPHTDQIKCQMEYNWCKLYPAVVMANRNLQEEDPNLADMLEQSIKGITGPEPVKTLRCLLENYITLCADADKRNTAHTNMKLIARALSPEWENGDKL